MKLHIPKLKKHYDKTNKTFYYYSDRLLKDDILIKFKSDESLIVAILDHKNAQEFIMVSEKLSPIQYRRIIRDILIMHRCQSKVEFTQAIRELSEEFDTGRKQKTKEQAEEMFSQLIWELTLIETVEMQMREANENENQTLNS
jgi:hypothetical protein